MGTSSVVEARPILIVEDHPVVASATQLLLSNMDASLVITTSDNAGMAVKEFQRQQNWFRILLDLDVPGAYGLSLARQFCRLGAAARCAVITGSDNPQWMAEARALGMMGYISKAMPIEGFAEALQSIIDGRPVFSQSAQRAEQGATRLTRRQQDVISLLYRGYSSKQIAAQLKLSEGTVDNHVSGLLRALNVSNRTHAIAKAMELGYTSIPCK